MSIVLRCLFAAVVAALCAQQALAQPVNSCPPGQAMQSSDPSGRKITCVPVPDMGTINDAIAAEAAARANADQALGARIDALTPADIIGTWATTGPTTCLQAASGFSSQLSPLLPGSGGVAFNAVSLLTGNFSGSYTFFAGGMGRSVGASHVVTSASTLFGAPPPGFPTNGGASVATLDSNFNWTVSGDTVTIDHRDPVVQPITVPNNGRTATIDRVPLFVGTVSKDKRTMVLTHSTMTLETSVTRDANGNQLSSTPRFCSRSRVMTRLN